MKLLSVPGTGPPKKAEVLHQCINITNRRDTVTTQSTSPLLLQRQWHLRAWSNTVHPSCVALWKPKTKQSIWSELAMNTKNLKELCKSCCPSEPCARQETLYWRKQKSSELRRLGESSPMGKDYFYSASSTNRHLNAGNVEAPTDLIKHSLTLCQNSTGSRRKLQADNIYVELQSSTKTTSSLSSSCNSCFSLTSLYAYPYTSYCSATTATILSLEHCVYLLLGSPMYCFPISPSLTRLSGVSDISVGHAYIIRIFGW